MIYFPPIVLQLVGAAGALGVFSGVLLHLLGAVVGIVAGLALWRYVIQPWVMERILADPAHTALLEKITLLEHVQARIRDAANAMQSNVGWAGAAIKLFTDIIVRSLTWAYIRADRIALHIHKVIEPGLTWSHTNIARIWLHINKIVNPSIDAFNWAIHGIRTHIHQRIEPAIIAAKTFARKFTLEQVRNLRDYINTNVLGRIATIAATAAATAAWVRTWAPALQNIERNCGDFLRRLCAVDKRWFWALLLTPWAALLAAIMKIMVPLTPMIIRSLEEVAERTWD